MAEGMESEYLTTALTLGLAYQLIDVDENPDSFEAVAMCSCCPPRTGAVDEAARDLTRRAAPQFSPDSSPSSFSPYRHPSVAAPTNTRGARAPLRVAVQRRNVIDV
jgi:hypothetical protein